MRECPRERVHRGGIHKTNEIGAAVTGTGRRAEQLEKGGRMKAAVFYGPKDVRLEDVPEPEIRDGSVKVKLDWCGI